MPVGSRVGVSAFQRCVCGFRSFVPFCSECNRWQTCEIDGSDTNWNDAFHGSLQIMQLEDFLDLHLFDHCCRSFVPFCLLFLKARLVLFVVSLRVLSGKGSKFSKAHTARHIPHSLWPVPSCCQQFLVVQVEWGAWTSFESILRKSGQTMKIYEKSWLLFYWLLLASIIVMVRKKTCKLDDAMLLGSRMADPGINCMFVGNHSWLDTKPPLGWWFQILETKIDPWKLDTIISYLITHQRTSWTSTSIWPPYFFRAQ